MDQQVLDLLPSWRQDTSQLFTASRRVALELVEALTEQQVSALECAVVLINAYNRISIGSGHPPVRR